MAARTDNDFSDFSRAQSRYFRATQSLFAVQKSELSVQRVSGQTGNSSTWHIVNCMVISCVCVCRQGQYLIMPPPKVAADDQVIHAFGKAWYFLSNQLGEKGRVPINVSELLPAF